MLDRNVCAPPVVAANKTSQAADFIVDTPPPLPLSQAGSPEGEHRMELVFAVPQQHHHPQHNGAVTRPNETPTPLTDLASALNHAAKLLSTSSSSADAAVASLQNAHQMIGSFLAQLESRLPAADEDEPMSDRREGEEGDGGEGSRIIDEMEEGMRECVLPSKRRKRQVSPSWSVGRVADQGEELSSVHPMDRRQSSMDLVFQFHA